MAFCFFGNEVPKGYVEFTPNNLWPDSAWVPDSLRHHQMPDAQNLLVGVTRNATEVGTIWSQGKIAFDPLSVPATGLGLSEGATGRMVIESITLDQSCLRTGACILLDPRRPRGSEDVMLKISGESNGNEGGGSIRFGAERLPIALSGSAKVTIPPISLDDISKTPQHVRCRLIVRE